MKEIVLAVISLLLIFCSSFAMYLYLTYRKKEEKTAKNFSQITLSKGTIILTVVVGLLSIIFFLYSWFFANATFLKSFMNAETFIWISMLGYIDYKEKIIPNKLILIGIGFWFVLSLLEIFVAHTPWKQVILFSLIGAGICGGVLLVIALIVKSALGMGDVKMFAVIGLLYGITNTYSILLFSILIMAAVSFVLLITKKVTRKAAIPMAPFVVLGFMISVLLGM